MQAVGLAHGSYNIRNTSLRPLKGFVIIFEEYTTGKTDFPDPSLADFQCDRTLWGFCFCVVVKIADGKADAVAL